MYRYPANTRVCVYACVCAGLGRLNEKREYVTSLESIPEKGSDVPWGPSRSVWIWSVSCRKVPERCLSIHTTVCFGNKSKLSFDLDGTGLVLNL